jgi:hypothetical protein
MPVMSSGLGASSPKNLDVSWVLIRHTRIAGLQSLILSPTPSEAVTTIKVMANITILIYIESLIPVSRA